MKDSRFKRTARLVAAGMLTLSLAAAAPSPGQNLQFLRQLYTDLLGRGVDLGAMANWLVFLDNGGLRIQVAGAVTSSTEYRTRLIGEMYSDYLNRNPNPQEAAFYVAFLQQGGTDDQVRSYILASEEFFQKSGGTNQGFLMQLYQDVLGRSIDRLSLVTFESALANGTTREAIAAIVLSSLESERRKIEGWSLRFLRRPADPTMLTNYSAALQAGATDEQIIDLIVSSDEYFAYATHHRS